MTRRTLARQFMNGQVEAPASVDGARLMPVTVKSGRAASLTRGVAHLVEAAALAVDERGAVLTARWECNGGSVNAAPVSTTEGYAACANCAEAIRLPRGPVVYRCIDDEGAVIYIGSSIDVRSRVRAHRSGTPWWDEVVDVQTESFPNEAACRLAEALAIRDEQPFYNRHGVVSDRAEVAT